MNQFRLVRLPVEDSMLYTLQPTANDLHVSLDLGGLLKSGSTAFNSPTEQLAGRLNQIQTQEICTSFDIGTQIASLLVKTVAIISGQNQLLSIKSEDLFVKNWDSEANDLNEKLSRLPFTGLVIDRKLVTATDIQKNLCSLKTNLDKKMEKNPANCSKLRLYVK